MSNTTSRMPFGKQFSPTQADLAVLLNLASRPKDCGEFENLVLATYFAKRPTSQKTLAMNTRISMQQYGLLDEHCSLTDVGKELLSRSNNPLDMHNAFAKHILLQCYGIQLLQAVRTLVHIGGVLSVPNVAAELKRMNIDAGGRSGEKLNPMRLWLEKAGVFRRDWDIDESTVERLLGVNVSTMNALSGLNSEQRAFVAALAGLPDPDAPRSSAEVARLAEQQSAVRYDVKQLPKRVLFPLQDAGLVTVAKTTKGRGAKPYLVAATSRLVGELAEPTIRSLEKTAALLDPRVLRRRFRELVLEIRDTSLSADRRGKSLEGLALQILLALNLEFSGWRKRAPETGGAEVDLIACERNGKFALWQIQCKVSSISSREPVDREVGVAQQLRSDVIAFITAGSVGAAARRAAEGYMRSTGISIIFLDGGDLDSIAAAGTPRNALEREFDRVRRARGSKGG